MSVVTDLCNTSVFSGRLACTLTPRCADDHKEAQGMHNSLL